MADVVSIEREYSAPPERVFRAWVDLDLLRQWFGCGPGMLWTVHEWDVRVGGAIHVSLDFDTGPFEVKGEFLVVEPPHRLRYRWSDNQTVDVAIAAAGTGSRVTVRHSGLAESECPVVDAGWSSALTQLEPVAK
jgi:uncharacterized protein YndB with AHSA1/START domain